MNCSGCNWPYARRDLHDGMCLECVGAELESLRRRFDGLSMESTRDHFANREQIKVITKAFFKVAKQRDAAVKAARRWKEKALLEKRLASYLNRAVKRLKEKAK
jgi:hypothetical protein